MRGLVHRLLHLGIDDRTPAREAKHIIITNAVTLLTGGQAVAVIALAFAAGLRITPYWLAGSVVGYLAVLALSAGGRHGAARLVLTLTATAAVMGGLLIGPGARTELYFFVAVAGAWFVFPSARHAALATIWYLAAYVALLLLYAQVPPLDPLPVGVVTWFQPILTGAVLLGLLGFAAWSHWQTAQTDRLLQQEHQRADDLLRNVLPAPIAERLKQNPDAIADHFPEATVLFADIVGFTALAERLSATRVVAILDELFSAFDDIAQQHGLEKIKTIGDAYMVVGGVPTPRPDHAQAIAAMALDMRDTIARLKPEGVTLQLRIGIDSGPVVAGVIGKRKFLYDLWGDTVNTASRMESHGLVDEVQVTQATYQRLRDAFVLEPRGAIQVKGKGEMTTYLLKRRA